MAENPILIIDGEEWVLEEDMDLLDSLTVCAVEGNC